MFSKFPRTTQPAASASGDAWAGMRQPEPTNLFQDMKYGIQQHRDRINSMSPDEKNRLEGFNQMAMSEPDRPQFSPVSFSGNANAGSLSMLVEELKKRGMF